MPQRQPQWDLDSDVPDGFEFLNESTPEHLQTDAPSPWAPRMLFLLLAGVVAVAIIAALTFNVLRARPDAETSTPRPPATADAPESGTPSVPTPTSPTPAPTTPPELPDSAPVQVLAHLDVKGRAPTTAYERERFGPDWADVDGNGCDTRNDILARDLTQIVTDPGDTCEVETGKLLDPYSNAEIDFTRGWETSFAVQIDHVVALSNAWQTGAQYWKPRKRLRFANDPLNLLAVDGGLNMQKSDGDAATWLPPSKPYRCSYVARQIAVKEKYGLWLTAPERDAMARILATCPTQGLPS